MTALNGEFGHAYRRVVLGANPRAGGDVVRLAFVLVDQAYAQGSVVVATSWRFLEGETCLYGRSLRRARDWLVHHELLAYSVEGAGRGARSQWELLLPETCAPTRTKERAQKRAHKRAHKRAQERAHPRAPGPVQVQVRGERVRAHAQAPPDEKQSKKNDQPRALPGWPEVEP